MSPEQKARKNALRRERRENDDYRKREAQLERERYARMSPEQKAADRARRAAQPSKKKMAEYQRKWRQKLSPEMKRYYLDRSNEWRRNNPEQSARGRRNKLKSTYGLSVEAFDALLLKQGGCCAICRANTPRSKRSWHVDHNHSTGHVRGLLCHHCNLAIGHVSDSIEILQQAIKYLGLFQTG
jgi:hypothetical protein